MHRALAIPALLLGLAACARPGISAGAAPQAAVAAPDAAGTYEYTAVEGGSPYTSIFTLTRSSNGSYRGVIVGPRGEKLQTDSVAAENGTLVLHAPTDRSVLVVKLTEFEPGAYTGTWSHYGSTGPVAARRRW